MRSAFAIIGLILAWTAPAKASRIDVPADHATIGAALAAASPSDTIQVAPGTYSASSNGESFPLVLNTNGVHLIGSGIGVTILDAEGAAGAVVVDAANGGRVSGFTITGGTTDFGGGISVVRGNPEVDHNLVVGNGARLRGAGIFVQSATSVASAPAAAVAALAGAPNPFRATASVRFTLARPSAVVVEIVDVTGRLVRRLEGGARAAGTHAIAWDGRNQDGSNMASGVYLACVRCDSGVASIPIVRLHR